MAGDINVLVEAEFVSRIAEVHPSMKEPVQAKLRSLKRDLVGDERSPSELEDLLIERIVMCWVHLHYLELRYAAVLRQESGDVEFLHRQVDRAEGRYQRAIKKLADLRRLDLPAIQVNIGAQQVNVA